MCGIVGLSLAEPSPAAGEVLDAMTASIGHRGPDSSGRYECPRQRTHLGFRRLAVRDLDARANQPMRSASGQTVVVFNGEIYNSAELGKRLCPDVAFRTTGDSEVLLESFERHGEDVFGQLNGMFAAALFDLRTRQLTLVRDRMGKKPLYLYQGGGFVAFASELRAIKPFGPQIDPDNVPLFFHLGYLPSPCTIYRDTTQVCPGEIVRIRDGQILSRSRFFAFTRENWSHREEADMTQLDASLADAVSCRTLSDVPVGAFLSGGVDSALVVAHLARGQRRPIPTFTVAFTEADHNEAELAAETAEFLRVPHEIISVDETRLPQLAEDFVDCYEQPYADTSGLATMLLCQAVKQRVTVALSGDGGDEFFGGYVRYRWFQHALHAQRLPRLLRWGMRQAAPRLDPSRGHRIARWLAARDAAGLYAEIIRNWTATDASELMPDALSSGQRAPQLVRDVFGRVAADPLAQAACFDATYYIPDDLQVKLDRASMRVALEVRCPLLDMRVTRMGIELQSATKFRHGLKSTLKRALGEHLPRNLVERPKHGFSVPLASWLRGPLRDLVHETLGCHAFREAGWLNHQLIQRLWTELSAGKTQWAHGIWMLFMLASTVDRQTTRVYPVLYPSKTLLVA